MDVRVAYFPRSDIILFEHDKLSRIQYNNTRKQVFKNSKDFAVSVEVLQRVGWMSVRRHRRGRGGGGYGACCPIGAVVVVSGGLLLSVLVWWQQVIARFSGRPTTQGRAKAQAKSAALVEFLKGRHLLVKLKFTPRRE